MKKLIGILILISVAQIIHAETLGECLNNADGVYAIQAAACWLCPPGEIAPCLNANETAHNAAIADCLARLPYNAQVYRRQMFDYVSLKDYSR